MFFITRNIEANDLAMKGASFTVDQHFVLPDQKQFNLR